MNNEDARVAEATGQDEATALEALEVSGGETRTAILVLLAGLPPAEARERLQKEGGFVRKALQS